MKERKKIFQANGTRKWTDVTDVTDVALLSDQRDFKPELVRRNKVQFTQVKGMTNKENIMVLDIHS